jgi:hypothetical protein
MKMSGPAVGVFNARTVGAADVLGLGGEIPCGIQRDEPGVLHSAHLLQHACLIKGFVEIIEQAQEVMRRDRIERLADVIVAGDASHLKERTGVVASAGLFHAELITEKRRALGEEHREGRQGDVGHGVLGVVADAPIRQLSGDAAQPFDEMIEGARVVHATSNAGTEPKSTVTIV